MPRAQRFPRAVLVKGGRWVRLPRPLPKSPNDLSPSHSHQDEGHADQGYDTCDQGEPAQLGQALVVAAQPIIAGLAASGDADAAGIVQALCDHLQAREERSNRLQTRLRAVRTALRAKSHRCDNLQGQSKRLWYKVDSMRRMQLLSRMQKPRTRYPP